MPGKSSDQHRPDSSRTPSGESVSTPVWVTPLEGAFLLGLPEQTVNGWVKDGRVRSSRLKSSRHKPQIVLVRTADLIAVAEARPRDPVADGGWTIAPSGAGRQRDARSWRLPVSVLILAVLVSALLWLTWSARKRAETTPDRQVPATGLPGVGAHSPGGPGPDNTPLSGKPLVLGEVHHLQDGQWAASAVNVTNPNMDLWLPDSEVLFLALDESGQVIGRWQALVSLGPGQAKTVIAQAIDLGSAEAKLERVQAVLKPQPWEGASTFRPVDLHLANVRVVTGTEDVKVTGEIRNGEPEEINAEVSCALWDGNGDFAGAGLAYVEPPGDGLSPFVVPVVYHSSRAVSADCYAGLQ